MNELRSIEARRGIGALTRLKYKLRWNKIDNRLHSFLVSIILLLRSAGNHVLKAHVLVDLSVCFNGFCICAVLHYCSYQIRTRGAQTNPHAGFSKSVGGVSQPLNSL